MLNTCKSSEVRFSGNTVVIPSGERVSNTWGTCPRLWDNPGKLGLIPNASSTAHAEAEKDLSVWEGLAAYQLVGGVTAHRGSDG